MTLALGMGLSTLARSAGLPDLAPDQQLTAKCMLSVVSTLPEVTDAKLRVSAGATPSAPPLTFIDYAYRHRSRAVSPQISREEVDITGIISSKHGAFDLGGITSTEAPDLDDNDAGMFRITDAWEKTCGVSVVVMTD